MTFDWSPEEQEGVVQVERRRRAAPGGRTIRDKDWEGPRSVAHLDSTGSRVVAGESGRSSEADC